MAPSSIWCLQSFSFDPNCCFSHNHKMFTLYFTSSPLFELSGLQQHRTSGNTIQPELLIWPQPQWRQRGPWGHGRTRSLPSYSRWQRWTETNRTDGQVGKGHNEYMTVANMWSLHLISILHFLSWTGFSLRPRASSSSSQSERSASPLVMTSTHSLETMPRVALSTDDEGAFRLCPEIDSKWLYMYI